MMEYQSEYYTLNATNLLRLALCDHLDHYRAQVDHWCLRILSLMKSLSHKTVEMHSLTLK